MPPPISEAGFDAIDQDHNRSGPAVSPTAHGGIPLLATDAVPPTISSHQGALYVAIPVSQLLHTHNQHYVYVPVVNISRAYGEASTASVQADVARHNAYHQEIQQGSTNKKRPRAPQPSVPCVNCRKAKKGCSIGRPCERCIRFGLEDTCKDVSTHRKRAQYNLTPEQCQEPEVDALSYGLIDSFPPATAAGSMSQPFFQTPECLGSTVVASPGVGIGVHTYSSEPFNSDGSGYYPMGDVTFALQDQSDNGTSVPVVPGSF